MKKGETQHKAVRTRQSSKTSAPKPAAVSTLTRWPLGPLLLIVLGTLIYSNSFNCSFHLDDRNSIMENPAIQQLSDLSSLWADNTTRFIPYLSFALNYHFHGLDVEGYHYINLIIHLINGCLIWWLTLLLFASPALKTHPLARYKNQLALIVALLFVSHPLATQSVTYIVQRLASMATLFYLLSLCLYLKARTDTMANSLKYGIYSAAVLSGMASFLTKENAYTLPLAIILAELFFFTYPLPGNRMKQTRIFLVITAICALAIAGVFSFSSVQDSLEKSRGDSGTSTNSISIFDPIPPSGGTPYTITPANYLMTQFRVIGLYIRLLTVPAGQSIDHDIVPSSDFFDPPTLLSFLFIVGLLGLSVLLFKKNRLASFGILWFFLTLSVESSIIPIADLSFEHRTYLPSFGFFLAVAGGTLHLLAEKYKNVFFLVLVFVICINSTLPFNPNKIWKDELSLWNDAVNKSPDKARPYLNRGVAYWQLGQKQNAMADYEKAVSLNPLYYASAYYNLGTAYAAFNSWDNAILNYTKAIEITPDYVMAFDGRGVAHGNKQNMEEAIRDFSTAIAMAPTYATSYYNRGNIHSSQKRWNEAIEDYGKAIELNSKYADAYCNRSVAFASLGKWDQAISDCSESIRIDPNYVKAYFNRAITYYNQGKYPEAIRDYTAVTELQPGNSAAYYNRAVAYGNSGQWEKAIADYSKTIVLDPANQNAMSGREFAKSKLNRRN